MLKLCIYWEEFIILCLCVVLLPLVYGVSFVVVWFWEVWVTEYVSWGVVVMVRNIQTGCMVVVSL